MGILYIVFQFVPAIVPPAANGWLKNSKARDSNANLAGVNVQQ
jgi:hypothetical protein